MSQKDGEGSSGGEKGGGATDAGEVVQKVALYELLFTFADRLDVILMIVGSLGAVGNGVSQSLYSLLFGNMINSFGSASQSSVVKSVSEVALKLVYLAIGTGIAGFLQVSCWMITGERQSAHIRSLYLKTILRQDIGFFDTQTTTRNSHRRERTKF